MRLVIGLLFVLSFVTDGLAATIRVSPRATPTSATHLKLTPRTVAREAGTSSSAPTAFGGARGVTVLNCENDNVIDAGSTLRLLPGDRAGNIFELGPQQEPRVVDSVAIGLLPQDASDFPVLLWLDIYVYDPQDDTFVNVAPFDVTIDAPLDAAGEILDVDLSEFGVEVDHDVLTLCGDQTNTTIDDVVNPAGDASPRCLSASGNNVCSVLLPFDESTLYIYGIDDDGCTSGTLNFDLVHELVLAPIVATETSSWSGVKARF